MGSYRLSRLAERDLAEILRYTINTWGMEQGTAYLQLLLIGRDRFMNHPKSPGSKTREDLADGCRAFRVGKHVIFYRTNGKVLEIARILHQSKDFPQHVSEKTFL